MAAFFQSLGKTITAGVVVLIVLLIILAGMGGKVAIGDHAWWLFAMRWLHVTSGVMWIGLLWYFNFVQTPSMPKIPDEQKPAVSKVIAPTALFWFRWAAMATIILGLILALVTPLCYARLLPELIAERDWLQAALAAAQLLVLATAASGLISAPG